MNVVEVLDLNKYEDSNRKRNVCAYARVSTLQEKQESSIESQIMHYTELIQQNESYNFMGVFIDHGVSGTSTQYRDQFKMMLQLAETGNLDMIITKSISRFARNTVDCLSSISLLKEYGTEVWFETENISSMDPKIEFVISVIAGMAQEESRIISENITWSYQKRFTNGVTPMNTAKLLGYERDENKQIIINEDEAKVVRLIFELYSNDKSLYDIAKHLSSMGLKTKSGNVNYYEFAVSRILDNEKYTGNALLQKYHVKELGSRIKVRSDGIKQQYYVTNSHPAIITQEKFDKVQLIKQQRMMKYNKTLNRADIKKKQQKTKYANLLVCGNCGKHYTHRTNHRGKPYEKSFLICSSNKNKKICPNDSISTDLINKITERVMDTINRNKKLCSRKVLIRIA
jgi:DNA invertase Pin-like site-specific DNA recombinase